MSGLVAYPRVDIPQKDKNDEWCKSFLNYSESLITNYNRVRTKMTRMFNGYNGVKDPASIAWLTQRYGQVDKAPYITYRLGRTKIDLLWGEWIKRPLISTVTTVNSSAVAEKMRQRDFIRGAMVAAPELQRVKEVAGIDPTEGMDIPQDVSEFEKMNFKEQCEDVMQIILNQQVKKLDAKQKLGEVFRDYILTNYAGAKIEIDDQGKVNVTDLDPRQCIFIAMKGDNYAEKSPIKGSAVPMTIPMVLMRYELTKEQRDTLDTIRKNPNNYIGTNNLGRGYVRYDNEGELVVDVIHIEWDSLTPLYYKVVPKNQNQLMIDPSETHLTFQIDTEKYEANKEAYDKKIAKEGGKVVTKFIEDKYEATRIGGLIDVNMRKVPKKRSVDDPSTILSTSYVFYVHGRVNGTTVPLQQIMENLDNLNDIVMFMLNRDLAKSKGRILTIDRSAIGAKEKIVDQLYRMVNDQILEYDSSAAGNMSGRQLDPATLFKQFDLGLSESFPYLLQMKADIRNEINMITGINENRQGVTAASSTATAQQTDIANSRTITEALFYGFSGFTKRVMQQIVNKSALSWAYYQTEEGMQVLGGERYAFLIDNLESLAHRDYSVDIEDGGLYAELSQRLDQLMQVSLNAGDIRLMDAMNVMLSETLAQKKQFLINGWAEVTRIQQQQQQAEMQNQAAMAQQQLATQIQIAQENREDQQAAKVTEIQVKGQVQTQVDDNKAQNDLILQNLKNAHEINTLPPIAEQ